MRLFLLTFLLSVPMFMFAAPGIPHQLHGTVKDFTSGTLSVLIDDVIVATTPIQDDGTFGESPNLFFITDANGVYGGKTMTFKINTADADGNVVFKNGALTKVDTELHIIRPDNAPAPVSVSITIVPGDLNKDGFVNTEDFNMFLAQWGAPITDINSDGVVNALDFNILMANWS